ncbi:MAG: helicase HerA-like domain-containing protein, partial [Thermohalobaculum sp.]|nr:helicase HerA-like domain-containing protein [Thermohalobaculum sp.]
SSRLGPCAEATRAAVMRASPVAGIYDRAVDRESAYELLRARAEKRAADEAAAADAATDARLRADEARDPDGYRQGTPWGGGRPATRSRSSRSDTTAEALVKSAVRAAGSQLGRSVVRSLIRGLFR